MGDAFYDDLDTYGTLRLQRQHHRNDHSGGRGTGIDCRRLGLERGGQYHRIIGRPDDLQGDRNPLEFLRLGYHGAGRRQQQDLDDSPLQERLDVEP